MLLASLDDANAAGADEAEWRVIMPWSGLRVWVSPASLDDEHVASANRANGVLKLLS